MRGRIFLYSLFVLVLFCSVNAHAGTWLSHNVLVKAQPDECFVDVGVDYPNGIAGYSPTAGPPCPLGSIQKTNQTYVWGLTRSGDSLWFGTGPNVFCTTMAMYLGTGDTALDSLAYVCEYGQSELARQGLEIDKYGDVRPPKVYEYDLVSRTLTDRTPDDPLLKETVGFRSAGSFNGVVFMAGGSTISNAVNMFAFDANTRQYLGSHVFTNGGTIRKWIVVNNQLYTGMGIDGKPGKILRWYGSATDVWKFVTVGTVDGVPRELAEYRGADGKLRIAISANGLWVSPAIELPQGLPQSSANWKVTWTPQDYEPDVVTSNAYGGGANYQFDGWLYWGTMHIPGRGAYLHEQCTYTNYCFGTPQTPEEQATLDAGTARATSIWRARNLESANPEVQLLYGETELPKFNPATRTFDLTTTGWTPLYGASGFGNSNNGYTWEMQTANGRLFIGTLDFTGADLWRFDSSNLPAVLEDGAGLGDFRNYGIRTMEVSPDSNTLYCGTASYANLRSNAGFELHELIYAAPTNKLPQVVMSPGAGTFTDSVAVSLSVSTSGASIYYTLDGTEPTQYSTPYISPIVLTQTTTVNTRAFLGGYLPSDLATATFTRNGAFDFTLSNDGDKAVVKGVPVQNTISSKIVSGATEAVTFSAAGLPEGATASFSPDSCSPTCSTVLTINTPEETTVGTYSIVVTGTAGTLVKTTGFTLTVSEPTVKVSTPVFAPKGGLFSESVTVAISTSTAGASIYYTLDGTDPTQISTLYAAAIVLTKTTTVKARAYAAGYLQSDAATATYNRAFDFTLSNNGGDKSVVRGSSVQNTIVGKLVSGVTQAVTFSVSGIPDGATASFSVGSCSPTCSTVLTISTTASTLAGAYPITVTGIAGTVVRTTGFTLTVSEPCATVTAAQLTSTSISLGRNVTENATVTNQGSCSSLPTGTVVFQVSTDGATWSNFGGAITLDSSGNAASNRYTPQNASTYYFRAIYKGDKGHQGSQSGDTANMLTVAKATTTVAILLSDSVISRGGSVTGTMTISTSATGSLPQAGGTWSVQASRDSTFATGLMMVDSGTVSGSLPFSISTKPFSPPAAGTWYFRATYSGDDNFRASRSGNAVLTVQ